MSFIGVRLIALILSPGLAGGAGVRQHRHLTGVLDGRGDVALVLGAVAGDPPGPYLASVGDELPQQARVLVIDVGDLFLAEQADFLSWLANRCFRHRGAPWESPACRGDGVWSDVRTVVRRTRPRRSCRRPRPTGLPARARRTRWATRRSRRTRRCRSRRWTGWTW